jgi:UDP-N-acetylmuramate dehydrogenase
MDEPLAPRTSFRLGGPADIYAAPLDAEDAEALIAHARAAGTPLFPLGGGTNVLVSDSGFRGVVMDTRSFRDLRPSPAGLYAGAGLPAEALCLRARELSLSGVEFLSGLPGTVGGAVFMNARCYDREIADVLARVDVLWRGKVLSLDAAGLPFSYKASPFQPGGEYSGALVLGAEIALAPGEGAAIGRRMEELARDREAKGHYRYPCAGSIFKNERSFGKPTGAILDGLGLKGRRIGGAAIADFHANIIVNLGGATAADVLALVELAERRALEELGLRLEREVVLVGDFG